MKTEQEYLADCSRYEAIKDLPECRDEKLKLVKEISDYENAIWDLPLPSEAEMSRIKKEEFGV